MKPRFKIKKFVIFITPLFAHFKHFLPFARILRFVNRATGIVHFFAFPARTIFAILSFCQFCLLGTSLSYLALNNLNMLTCNKARLQNS